MHSKLLCHFSSAFALLTASLRSICWTNLCNIVCLWSWTIAHRFEDFFNRVFGGLACLRYSFSHDCMTYLLPMKSPENFECISEDFGVYREFSIYAYRDVRTWQPPQLCNFVKEWVSFGCFFMNLLINYAFVLYDRYIRMIYLINNQYRLKNALLISCKMIRNHKRHGHLHGRHAIGNLEVRSEWKIYYKNK